MENWSRIISLGVGPIIVISACALLCLVFYNRLSTVVARLRLLQRERLHEQKAMGSLVVGAHGADVAALRHREILGALHVQTNHLMKRARLIQLTLTCLLLSIACLLLCSLSLGLAVLWPRVVFTAVILFVLGLFVLIAGIAFALVELRQALAPIELEALFVTNIAQDFDLVEKVV